MKWCPLDEIDGETEKLQYLVFEDWCWQWPGWKLIAKKLNDEFGNHR